MKSGFYRIFTAPEQTCFILCLNYFALQTFARCMRLYFSRHCALFTLRNLLNFCKPLRMWCWNFRSANKSVLMRILGGFGARPVHLLQTKWILIHLSLHAFTQRMHLPKLNHFYKKCLYNTAKWLKLWRGLWMIQHDTG